MSGVTDEAEIRRVFRKAFGSEPEAVASAPGRVNIIGEHTDYNGGYVLPTPIGTLIWVAVGRRKGDRVRIHAHDYRDGCEFELGKQAYSRERLWANYPLGVVDAILRKGLRLGGVDVAIKGDVPQGAGLSSSAALEVSIARALTALFKLEVDPVELAYIGKAAENGFVGIQSGVMDQFCASLGVPGRALLIDCRSNEHRLLPLPPGYTLVAVHTGLERKVESTAYNERVAQCREGVEAIREAGNPLVRELRDATPEMLEEARSRMSEVIYRRCRHVVTENVRVMEAKTSLEAGDAAKLGALMWESHRSLRDDYEVSCPELNALVDAARESCYVLGARLTGAGFGGCTINLLPEGNLDDFVNEVPRAYRALTGLEARVYRVWPK